MSKTDESGLRALRDRHAAFGCPYVRLNITDAVDAEMRLVALGSRLIRSQPRKVLLMELGPDGFGFKTPLWLPPDADWSVSLNFIMEGIPLTAAGRIVRVLEERHWRHYEVALDRNPVIRKLITRVLDQRLRRRSPALYLIHETYRKEKPSPKQE